MAVATADIQTRPARRGVSLGSALVVAGVLIGGTGLLAGLEYYRLPPVERVYSDLHRLFAPTGVVGHSLGYVGTLLVIVGVSGYVARKRVAALAGVGRLSTWLNVHIFLCTVGPFLVLLHTSFKFGGIAAISFWSMAIAVASGVFGRYLYAHIPRTLGGQVRALRAVEEDRLEAARAIEAAGGPTVAELDAVLGRRPTPPTGLAAAVAHALAGDVRARVARVRLRRLLARRVADPGTRARLRELARERLRMEQQIAVLVPFQRLFGYWHVLHLPIALVMFAALAVHVTVAILFGYAWPF